MITREATLVVEQVSVIGAAERLAEPGRSIRADSQEPVSQAGFVQVPYPGQSLADSDSHRRRLCLAGQCGEFLDQLVSLGILNIETHVPPFHPALATRVPSMSATGIGSSHRGMALDRPHHAGNGPRPVRAGSGLAYVF